jgi:hypothetical protein
MQRADLVPRWRPSGNVQSSDPFVLSHLQRFVLDFPVFPTNEILFVDQLYLILLSVRSLDTGSLHVFNLSLKEPGLSWKLVSYNWSQSSLLFLVGWRHCEWFPPSSGLWH